MRVLVTGGAGYIGSVVAEELLAQGHEVVVYDDLRKGHREAVDPQAFFVHADLLNEDLLTRTLQRHRIKAVVHMAAESLVGESVTDPAKFYRDNVEAGLALLRAMTAERVRYLVFSSTAAVYGEPAKQPIEEQDPTRPTNPYGETKLAFEHALRWYEGAYGLRYVSLRYFNAAGATEEHGEWHEPETHLIPLVLDVAAGRRESVTIYGEDYPTPDGTCIRDYIHVRDLARAHVLALTGLVEGHPSAIYNLGCGGRGYSVRQVLEAARRVTGRNIAVRVGPRRAGDPAILVASSRRIVTDLGFRAELQSLEEIIASAWHWLERHLALAPSATGPDVPAPTR